MHDLAARLRHHADADDLAALAEALEGAAAELSDLAAQCRRLAGRALDESAARRAAITEMTRRLDLLAAQVT
jgi:ABC-type transporter Mla subunit MlaD